MKNKIFNFLILICILIAVFHIIFKNNMENGFIKFTIKKINKSCQYADKQNLKLNINNNSILEIPVNPPTELCYKTKEYIIQQRKNYITKYLNDSIFEEPYYKPSEYVFGQIADNKPWISVNYCRKEDGTIRTNGASEESRFINNPALLVAIEYPFTYGADEIKNCLNKNYQMIPHRIQYKKQNKEIIVTYYFLPYILDGKNIFYQFNGINALDFGYKYAYIDKSKTTLKMKFHEKNNITNQITEFKNFIHTENSCEVEGGCNNGAPKQPMLEFGYTNEGKRINSPEIYIKLWRKKPNSTSEEPDISEIIRFIQPL